MAAALIEETSLSPLSESHTPAGMPYAIRSEHVSRVFGSGESRVEALRDVSIGIPAGSFTAVMGPSGSGKSTFLQCSAGLDQPSEGKIFLGDVEVTALREPKLTILRRERVGFVFQSFNLLPALSAWENIVLPIRMGGSRPDKHWVRWLVERVGLQGRERHRPAELSGGQQQRVAIARALVTKPAVVFADEPTGALDTRTGREILELLRDIVLDVGQTVVMVTHDPVAASYAQRVIFLADGRLVDALDAPTRDVVAARMTRLEP
jgi:putative ABC transport system ATP-binding protein